MSSNFFIIIISKNQKYLKSDFLIEKSIIFLIRRFYRLLRAIFFKSEIEKSGLGHFSAAWATDSKKPKIFKIRL